MSEAEATVSEKRGISRIWAVPIVALLLGAYMVFYTWQNQGPEITLTFQTAEGIEAGKTKIKTRSVDLGMVETLTLSEDHERVIVTARLEPNTETLLRDDSQFWVVRARIGKGGISGLGTVLSGGYIELAPGVGKEGRRDYVGIEEPPVTPVGTPGVQIELWSDTAVSVGTGDPIMYKGFEVGQIESEEFDFETRRTRNTAFINAPYNELVSTATRFWNMSGIYFDASADGVEIRTGSLQTLLVGGVTFGLPEGASPGDSVTHGARFELFPDEAAINEHPYEHYLEYVLLFDRSVRGLRPGAPVEYRGIPAGRVEGLMLKEIVTNEAAGEALPIRIRLEPGRILMGDTEAAAKELAGNVEESVSIGMRASLETGNLLTGSLYIALDLYPDAPKASVGDFLGYPTIPTIGGGLEQIQHQVTAFLDKLNALPLDDIAKNANTTITSVDDTVVELERTLAEVRTLVASDDTQGLPRSVEQTLAQIDATLRSLRELAATLEQKPNALIFPVEHQPDPEPQAGPQ